MNDENKLEVLQYWIDNPDKTAKIPPWLKGKITRGDIEKLMLEMPVSGIPTSPSSGTRTIGISDFFRHAERIRKKRKEELEISSIKLHDEVVKRQIQLQEELNKKYDRSNTIMQSQTWAMVFQIVVTIFLIVSTVFLGIESNRIAEGQNRISEIQANISQVQTEILRVSNPPYDPFIEVVADFEDLDIPAWQLVDEGSLQEEDVERRWAIVSLTIYNFGKMDSQHFYCYHDNLYSDFIAYLTPNDNFGNIAAGTSNRTRLHIAYKDCIHNNEGCGRPELVPVGNHNITLKCECYGCKTQREFTSLIDFCVYHTNKSKDCPDY